nr:MAG TPA: hypothetical protein [Bacteriophage sp.]
MINRKCYKRLAKEVSVLKYCMDVRFHTNNIILLFHT